MAISDGTPVDAANSNAAWVSRTVNTNTVGKVDLQNTDAVSGPDVINTQREINSLDSFSGRVAGSVFDAKPTWTNNDIGVSTDDLKTRVDLITQKFNQTLGHDHDGSAGNGKPVSAANLTNFNNFIGTIETFTFTGASGASVDVTTQLTAKTPGGGTSSAGVPTTSPHNLAEIRTQSNGEQLEDAQGQKIFGRITEAAGVWTLSFFTNEAGVETSTSISSTNIRVYFKEVFTMGTRPTFGDAALELGSLDYTADVVDATATQRGLVSTGAQTWAGVKTFNSNPILNALTAGSVLFLNATKNIFEAATNFFWDVTNNRLGLGTNTPAHRLDVSGDWGVRKRDEASAATLNAMVSTSSFVRITSTVTTINGIAGGTDGKRILIYNQSINTVSINHLNVGASASDQIQTSDANPIELPEGTATELVYDSGDSKWVVAAGSGAGANKQLSNLSSTAINTGLVFAVDPGAISTPNETGANSSFALDFFTGETVNGTSGIVTIVTGNASGTGISGAQILNTGNGAGSGKIELLTGNASAGNSGNILLTIGTASATQGVFKFLKTGVASVVGQIWTASATDGTGYWANAPAGGALVVTGTRAAPQNITAGGGIAFTGTQPRQMWFIQGSGGHVDVTASPQIAAATTVGQELILMGRNNAQTVLLENGTGLSLNGSWEGAEDSVLTLVWDSTNWVEVSRR